MKSNTTEKYKYNDNYYEEKIISYKTYDETQLNKHVSYIKTRSITPETFKSRRFIEETTQKIEISTENKQDIPLYLIDEYQFEKKDTTSHVFHFRVNPYHKELKDELEKHNKNPLIETNIENIETKSNQSGKSANTNKQEEFSKTIKLTEFENKLMKDVTKFLLEKETKTVLVDIFKRDGKTGKVDLKLEEDGRINTHTVVLYKNENKILVIDPNSPTFSSHLANFKSDTYHALTIEVSYSPNEIYKIYSKPEKTYTGEKTHTGYAKDKWRDCIDIAVKLAFGLNDLSFQALDIVYKSSFVKFITNNDKLDCNIFYKKTEPFRSKQSSDFEIVKNTNSKIQELFTIKRDSIIKETNKFVPLIESIKFSLKTTEDILQANLVNINNDCEQKIVGLDNDYF